MKKIAIGIAALFSLLSTVSFAAPAVTKNDTTIPCYNGGFSFGLAGYYLQPSPSTSTMNRENVEQAQTPQVKIKETDYK